MQKKKVIRYAVILDKPEHDLLNKIKSFNGASHKFIMKNALKLYAELALGEKK